MASFFCHAVAVTKQVRLERIVRPQWCTRWAPDGRHLTLAKSRCKQCHTVTVDEQTMPTIRVDEDVYAWLQKQARPFEDTPNTVLRRVAGLGDAAQPTAPTEAKGAKAMKQIATAARPLSGRKLNELWGVGAKHALYHREGSWYNNLERFPGALFDPNGYVVFATEQAYKNSRHLRITQETNVTNGIASIPGYVRMVG